ncbi:hypothetical protein TNCV_2602661 [Trichonephila clavipes]|nr:hypothetical protein TNCV_2602661 [Trichonephila clavipes]
MFEKKRISVGTRLEHEGCWKRELLNSELRENEGEALELDATLRISTLHIRNRDYTGMWVRRGSTKLMAGKVVFLRGLLSPIRVVDLTVMNPLRILFEVVRSALKSTYMPFLEAFFPLTSDRKNLPSRSELAARGHPLVHSFPLR